MHATSPTDHTTFVARAARHTTLLVLLALLAAMLLAASPAHAAEPTVQGQLLATPEVDLPTGPEVEAVPTAEPVLPPDIDDVTGPQLPPPPPPPPDDDIDDIQTPPADEPTATIDLDPRCEPDAGIAYDVAIAPEPDGPLAYKAQWRTPGGAVQTVDGQHGVISTGEGTFEVRGVVHYQGPGFYATDFVTVIVDCADPGEPHDDPVWPDDPRPATPTFTG
jgi:hypothetical protein